ncbi:hypothetical protein L3V82_07760 [Thiotrichales bacterium 19S3-7]|nr:hypothetical protein [Thiotrichales bacterium 19S3-7]MCF6802054.1 hypothetical protein [Thiotrichales bacterium 19S3-11]
MKTLVLLSSSLIIGLFATISSASAAYHNIVDGPKLASSKIPPPVVAGSSQTTALGAHGTPAMMKL